MPKYKITREATYTEVAYVEASSMREVFELDEAEELDFEFELDKGATIPFPVWHSEITIIESGE